METNSRIETRKNRFCNEGNEVILVNMLEMFSDELRRLMKEKNLRASDICKRCQISDARFSKVLMCEEKPTRTTAIKIALGLSLNAEEARDFILRLGYVLSPYSEIDILVEKALNDKVGYYGLYEILEAEGFPSLEEYYSWTRKQERRKKIQNSIKKDVA